MANKRIKKKTVKANIIRAIEIEQIKLQKIEVEAEMLDIKIQQAQYKIKGKQKTLEKLERQLNNIQLTIDRYEQKIRASWKKSIDITKEVGKKKYTEGQKDYVRALKIIEMALDKPAADIKAIYGSDDINELADQYYLPELGDYTQEDLNEIEKEFNKTHGYHIRLQNATNPFAGIDFNTLIPN